MIRRFIALGWFIAGALTGATLVPVLVFWVDLSFDLKVPIVGLAQLAATLFLALYIPLALDNYRDRLRSVRAMLIDEVTGLMSVVRSINSVLTGCAQAEVTTQQDLMKVKTAFLTANVKIVRLDGRVKSEYAGSCYKPLNDFRRSYEGYWHAVTDGALYAGTAVDWRLWRKQEFAFDVMDQSASDLARYLRTK
jgi:hypothetical protein